MQNLFSWVRTHKFTTFLLLIIALGAYIFFYNRGVMPVDLTMKSSSSISRMESAGSGGFTGLAAPAVDMAYNSRTMVSPVLPQSSDLSADERKVVTDTNFSLLVKDVSETIRSLRSQAEQLGGFMVNSSINRPEEGGNGTLLVRVPSDQLDLYLDQVRSAAVRVVSENVSGRDVTDQYTDIESRLATLTTTKQTYEAMLSKATDVDEILRVQQAIFSVQDQIDYYQGQLQYLENTTQSSLVTIYLSTDELSLPYAPADPWRPAVVFKTAVRSLMTTVRGVANLAIWAVVYSPILLVLILLYFLFRRIMKR